MAHVEISLTCFSLRETYLWYPWGVHFQQKQSWKPVSHAGLLAFPASPSMYVLSSSVNEKWQTQHDDLHIVMIASIMSKGTINVTFHELGLSLLCHCTTEHNLVWYRWVSNGFQKYRNGLRIRAWDSFHRLLSIYTNHFAYGGFIIPGNARVRREGKWMHASRSHVDGKALDRQALGA